MTPIRRVRRKPLERYFELVGEIIVLRLAFLLTMIGFPSLAFAYVDPGTGILLWQGLIALVGGLLVFFSHPLKWIKNLLERFRRK